MGDVVRPAAWSDEAKRDAIERKRLRSMERWPAVHAAIQRRRPTLDELLGLTTPQGPDAA